jgi:glutamate/tyrosine decarboxylase-like PLP-dependent enzyme
MNENTKFLAWFLGPKAENETMLEEMMLLTLRDYCHWRRNYFPSDNILVTRKLQRELADYYDKLYQNLLELVAELRRNFPFYSPRYIAHMLSDINIPSMIGYISGMLYNPNNVSTEAAPVTVDMEIEACNILLEMLGYNAPPDIPGELTDSNVEQYRKKLQREFGWAHLTLGGTTANLEALWVARSLKYAPLPIWDIARQKGLDIEVKFPNGQSQDIKEFSRHQLLMIKPNESVYLLARYIDAYRLKYGISVQNANEEASNLLMSSKYGLNKGLGELYCEYPLTVFVSGTAHYSIHKAVDILGIGRDNINYVDIGSDFRIDVNHLKKEIDNTLAQKRIPLAVIPIAGTTEEGAVDPVHRILKLRKEFENQKNVSFWIHVDAAWGGYFRSLFNFTHTDEVQAVMYKVAKQIGIPSGPGLLEWNTRFFEYIENNVQASIVSKDHEQDESEQSFEGGLQDKLKSGKKKMANLIESGDFPEYLRAFKALILNFRKYGLDEVESSLTLEDRINYVDEYVSEKMNLRYGDYNKEIELRWGSKDVANAFLRFSAADSITIDPHKMGYVNYPCGMIAFKNDRVRHFILQKAPYITSVRQDVLVHMPPKHIQGMDDGEPKIVVESFAPFIVEGSRPGAAASSLFLTVKSIAPTLREGGLIVKSSLLAARELFEWLVHWDAILKHNRLDADYEFKLLTVNPPDTNIVTFVVKKRTSNSLIKLNMLTDLVYERFSIQTELGEREYSYAQPFFLSKTVFHEPEYPFHSLKPLFERSFERGHLNQVRMDFQQYGLTVLRATVMNPYITVSRQVLNESILKDFLEELSSAADQAVVKV